MLGAVLAWPGAASAEVVWVGDFETGDTSQFNFVLNEEIDGTPYVNVLGEQVAEGEFAARIELFNDAVWPNGLKRVELQHRPDDPRTAEGATTFFAWSFYLPETLSVDPSQQIAYWESNGSFQQMMAFQVEGEEISFYTRRPDNVLQWQDGSALTPGEWHRSAMRVLWSTDPGVGEVDVWFDGDQVVDQASAQTLADSNPHFVQFGLLRGAVEFADVPTIYIDDAVEGDTLDDVRPDDLPGGGGESSSGSEGGGGESSSDGGGLTTGGMAGSSGGSLDGTTSSTPGTGGGAMTSVGSSGGSGGAATGSDGGADDDGGGCGCRGSGRAGTPWFLALALLGWRRRR